MRIKNYLRDMGIFLAIYFAGNFMWAAFQRGVPIGRLGMIIGAFGFFAVGTMTKAKRIYSLALVAISLWVITSYSILLGARPVDWAVTIFPIALTAVIGGVLSHVTSKQKTNA
jgi:hypothetical protein